MADHSEVERESVKSTMLGVLHKLTNSDDLFGFEDQELLLSFENNLFELFHLVN